MREVVCRDSFCAAVAVLSKNLSQRLFGFGLGFARRRYHRQETLDGLCRMSNLARVPQNRLMRLSAFILVVSIAFSLRAGTLSNLQDVPDGTISILLQEKISWALAQIESGHLKNPDEAQGLSGEVSRFQILPEVWKSYSRSKSYSDPRVAWHVARQILKDREDWFIAATGHPPTAFDLYVMWNKPGLYERLEFNRKRVPYRLRDVAERFENLVHDRSDLRVSLK